MKDAWHEGAMKRFADRSGAADTHRRVCSAMVGTAAPDHLLTFRLAVMIVILACDLDRGFDRFGATGTKERRRLIARRNFGEPRG